MLIERTIAARFLSSGCSCRTMSRHSGSHFSQTKARVSTWELNAGRPISIDIASSRFGLSLEDGIVSGGHTQRIEIGEALEDGPRRAASFLRNLRCRRHRGLAAKQPHEGLDDHLPSAFAAQAAAINRGKCENRFT